jgi:hypothetical protein
MTRLAKLFNATRLVQGAATVLTVTLALTVRVEHACSEPSKSNVSAYPAVLFAYSLRTKKTPYPFGYGAGYWWPTRPNKLDQ